MDILTGVWYNITVKGEQEAPAACRPLTNKEKGGLKA